MRTFVQVYLLIILAMKRIQNLLKLHGLKLRLPNLGEYTFPIWRVIRVLIVNLVFCSSLIMHHGQKWKLEIEN